MVKWRGSVSHPTKSVMSFLKSRQLIQRGCLAHLAHIRDTSVVTPMLESIPVVSEFSEVFLTDLPGLPPDRDIDFYIKGRRALNLFTFFHIVWHWLN